MPLGSFSQGISNMWLSGYSSVIYPTFGGTNINFINGFPDTSTIDRPMSFLDCNANISDSLGNLLFYTNGICIANAANDTMMNGDSLNPSTYTFNATYGLRVKQGNLILPLPGDSNKYYLFHETLFFDQSVSDYRSSEIYYSIIDMSLDSGKGDVIQKNIVLLSDTLTPGAITSCKHANGRDWWVVFHKSKGRRYYKYLLTPSGLQGPFAQDIGYAIAPNDWIWQSCFSPDGNKFSSVMARDTFDVMDFDRCTGLFSNFISICVNDSAGSRGVAFSPNSQVLYISSMIYIYQFNLNVVSIDSSKNIVSFFDRYADPNPPLYTAFYLAQLANDGKIYINTGNGTRWLNVINHPDSIGLSCDLLQHGFMLPTYNSFTIPNFPNYFLGREMGSICDTLPLRVHHEGELTNQERSNKFPISLVTDERGEAIQHGEFNFDERFTFRYFLEMTSRELQQNLQEEFPEQESQKSINSPKDLSKKNKIIK